MSANWYKYPDPFNDNKLSFSVTYLYTSLNLHSSLPSVRITPYELINSIQGGTGPFIYYIKKSTAGVWMSGTDPKTIYVEYGTSAVGQLSYIDVKVEDTTTYSQIQTWVEVQNNLGL